MEFYRPQVPFWNIVLAFLLSIGIVLCEIPLFYGDIQYSIAAYAVLLAVLSLAPLQLESETPLFQAFALIPVFRLVNFAMPIFGEPTLEWFTLIYGPFIPVFFYFGWESFSSGPAPAHLIPQSEAVSNDGGTTRLWRVGQELPWWIGGNRGGKLRWVVRKGRQFFTPPEGMSTRESVAHWGSRACVIVIVPVVLVALLTALFLATVYLAEVEYNLLTPSPLVPRLGFSQTVQLAVVMIVFVGFVEELLFRVILQKVLERRLGIVLGLLLASAIYGGVHLVHGDTTMILFGCGVGLFLGILYDLTDSFLLVSVVHGLGNVYLYGIIPLRGTSTSELLQTITDQIQQYVFVWITDLQPVLEFVSF
ncbi:CPBP family intramembrane glutamic endopeptidase [Halobacteriaceae archaeon SHR40]|uniref:CPBP family intramembrane glutamic endopeptidase n=1 Tax=Halovenus amylolytica TaxID=2500550 RepID=UPI000FE2B438